GAYAFLAKPIYEANILIQVEDSAGSSKNILGDLAGVFDLKTAATAEMEIMRSRMVVSRAVDNTRLYITVQPKYFPLIGAGLARRNKELSEPGLFGLQGYVWGAEAANVSVFNVPDHLQGERFTITAHDNGDYTLSQSDYDIRLEG